MPRCGLNANAGRKVAAADIATARGLAQSQKAVPMPYGCATCRLYLSLRSGTPLAHSRVSLRKWVLAIYLCATSLTGVSDMQLRRDFGSTRRTAWFVLHCLPKAWDASVPTAWSKRTKPMSAARKVRSTSPKSWSPRRSLRACRSTPTPPGYDRLENHEFVNTVGATMCAAYM